MSPSRKSSAFMGLGKNACVIINSRIQYKTTLQKERQREGKVKCGEEKISELSPPQRSSWGHSARAMFLHFFLSTFFEVCLSIERASLIVGNKNAHTVVVRSGVVQQPGISPVGEGQQTVLQKFLQKTIDVTAPAVMDPFVTEALSQYNFFEKL